MSNVSIAGYAGWPAYDTFLIVLLSGRPVYDLNPLRPNPNSKKPVSGSCRVRGLGWTLTPLGLGSLVKGAQIPPLCFGWVKSYGNSYPRTRSSFPQMVRLSSSVFLVPTQSSLTSALTVAPSKPSSWTHFLQIHCNEFAGPRSHPFMGLVLKSRPYYILATLVFKLLY